MKAVEYISAADGSWRPGDRRGTLAIPQVSPRPPVQCRATVRHEAAPAAAAPPPVAARPRVRRARSDSSDRAVAGRRVLWLEVATLLVAAMTPLVLWHDTLIGIASAFHWELGYFPGLVPSILMALGLACYVPVVAHRVRSLSGGRFYRAQPQAWQGWAISLYLLGFVLATQVAQLAREASAP